MAQQTDSQLVTDALVIQNETTPSANTATRVGEMLVDIIDSKKNNLEYLEYLAIMDYNGTAFTINVLSNTFSTSFTWTNPSSGIFRVTADVGTPFTLSKTVVSNGSWSPGSSAPYIVCGQQRTPFETSQVDFRFFFHDGTLTGTPNNVKYPVWIRVYP